MSRPGTRLRSLARRVFDAKTMERLIDPVIADLQCEHDAALGRGDVWRSRWIRAGGYAALAKVVAIAGPSLAFGGQDNASQGSVRRTVVISLIATLVMTAFFILPLPPAARASGHVMRIVWYLVPQALSVGMPMGVVFGILAGLRGRPPVRRSAWIIAAITLAASVAMFVNVAWIMPSANQSFREIMFGGPLARGTNELTLASLASLNPAELQVRIALACSPTVLGLFALAVAAAWRGIYGWIAMCATSLATYATYYTLLYNANTAALSGRRPPAAGWVANAVFMAIALLLLSRSVSRGSGPRSADESL